MHRLLPSVGLLVCLGVLITAPQWASGQPYLLHMLVLACVLVVPAVGLNLMLGYSGLDMDGVFAVVMDNRRNNPRFTKSLHTLAKCFARLY